MSQKQMLCGVRIDAYIATYNDLPLVTMKQLGSEGTFFLTPDEARALGVALANAADFADAKPTTKDPAR